MGHIRALLAFALLSATCHAQALPPNGGYGLQLGMLNDDAAPAKFWAVMAVAPGSPAANAGIEAGDKIIYVNNLEANKASYATLSATISVDFLLFRARDNTFIKVTSLGRASNYSFAPAGDEATQQKFIDAYVAEERQKAVNEASAFTPAPAAVPQAIEPSLPPPPAKKPGFWSNLGTALATAGNSQIAGTWQGGKSEHDYAHGGYVNADWTFIFGADGTYDEAVFVGGQQAMHAAGTYSFIAASKPGDRTVTNLLTFTPASCDYTSRELAQVVAPFPIPTNMAIQEYINFFRLSDGNTMMLQNAGRNGSDSWQMKAR